jgi:hypothetical protein
MSTVPYISSLAVNLWPEVSGLSAERSKLDFVTLMGPSHYGEGTRGNPVIPVLGFLMIDYIYPLSLVPPYTAQELSFVKYFSLRSHSPPTRKVYLQMPRFTRAAQSTTRTSGILPVEIWTTILDLTIHVPRLLDTTCTDSSFALYRGLGSSPYNDEKAYRTSERQRLILGAVCSAWRGWADARKHRYIVMTDAGVPPEAIPNAVRVPLLVRSPTELKIRLDRPSRWRILDARVHLSSHAICFKHLSLHAEKHPLLCRINLSLRLRVEGQCEVMQCLAAFKHLTYLSLDLRKGERSWVSWDLFHTAVQTKDPNTPACTITLPNVRVLEYLSETRLPSTWTVPSTDDPSPAFILNLPQLEHLYFYGRLPGEKLEFELLTPFTLRGIRSLVVGVGATLDIEWSELPNLEELACLNFEPRIKAPIPKAHPLQQVWLVGSWSIGTFDALTAGLGEGNGDNLRELHLCAMHWDQGGHPIPAPLEGRSGPQANDEAMDNFCDKVDRFWELYGLKTLDYYGCTRNSPYQPKVTTDEEDEV